MPRRTGSPVPGGGPTLKSVIEKPSERWRSLAAEQEAAIAAGILLRGEAWAVALWPQEFIEAVDAALTAYEREVESLPAKTDEAIWAAVERVVLALNAADEACIETDEREDLCEYIDQVLAAEGVDVGALTARRGFSRHELTDQWRDW